VTSRQSLSQDGAPSDESADTMRLFCGAARPQPRATTDASLCLRTIRTFETIAYAPLEQEVTVRGLSVRILNISEMIVTPSIPS
jgi:hypothetical protein